MFWLENNIFRPGLRITEQDELCRRHSQAVSHEIE
jgi:hypothetical protein